VKSNRRLKKKKMVIHTPGRVTKKTTKRENGGVGCADTVSKESRFLVLETGRGLCYLLALLINS